MISCLHNTPGLSATVPYLERSLARIRWDRPMSSPVVVSRGGQQSRIWPLRPEANARCGLPPLFLRLTCLAPSVDIRWRPLVSEVVVTDLVTDRPRGAGARRQCYLPGCNGVTFSGLSSTLAAAASTASANPGTDSLNRARNSWTALSMISWSVRASVKAIASRSCRLVAAVARYPIGSAGSARGGRPRRRGVSSGTPPPFRPVYS